MYTYIQYDDRYRKFNINNEYNNRYDTYMTQIRIVRHHNMSRPCPIIKYTYIYQCIRHEQIYNAVAISITYNKISSVAFHQYVGGIVIYVDGSDISWS